ncbi:hypothetical protein [Streptomyces sulphureus]|uniref:hypothetical protein n=1 Tax=Streptomyces sulphureus TaxID=47758 RepID=UPI00035C9505|nr:hypothetical protein [Streptomyces sulphureus]
MIAALLLVGALAVGRLRPYDRLDTWVWRRLTFGGKWTRTRRGQLLVLVAHAIARPAATARIWRHRHDPPPRRSAPLRVPTVEPSDPSGQADNVRPDDPDTTPHPTPDTPPTSTDSP